MPRTLDLRTVAVRTIPLDTGHELPAPVVPPLIETAEAAHPELAAADFSAGEELFAWETLDAQPLPESRRWLTLSGSALILGAAGAIWFGNMLFAAMLVISGSLLIASAFRRPKTITVRVTDRGVRVGSELYEYENAQSFWISYDPPLFKELTILVKRSFMPRIRIPLGDTDPVELRETLLEYLPEERYEESTIDTLAKFLGF
ncbi:hypothetical protein C4552_00590 [Candidatus Parcubacteria bacterium]|nr:MAG: hypothetical protein C4552_00590 [Candidatus Parcubacteria bacterium]